MKRSFIQKGLIALLIILAFGLTSVGCKLTDKAGNQDNDVESGDDGNQVVSVDKNALLVELALEVAEQGDYTADSYNAYLAKLSAAKEVAGNEAATQESVDNATAELSAARLALAIRPVEEVAGANKSFRMLPGDTKEITLSDYVNVNHLSKITYKVKTSNAVVTLGDISDGKFTFTAGEVSKETNLTVSIVVCYDGVEKLKVDLAVGISDDVTPTLGTLELVKKYDMLSLANRESILIDFAENVNNAGDLALTYSVKCDGEDVALDGSKCTLALGNYTEEYTYTTFMVTVTCTANGEEKTLEYTYKLAIKDTRGYSIPNGNFENGLDGWTLTNTAGDAPFGGIDNKTLYWVQNFPMNNVGSYFSAYADGTSEASQGTLASPYFVARGDYATYMLGGAGNPNVYITIEDKNGNVLALYRNTMFADLPEGVTDFDAQRELVGTTVFLANFVTYKVSIAQWAGEEIRFVVHDHASENWGVVFFDELITYYSSTDVIPENAVLAENLLANKSALMAELALEVTAQGDYTADSYNAYLAKLAAAKALVDDLAVTQESVDVVVAELTVARLALLGYTAYRRRHVLFLLHR